jgi:hypothetical protein
MIGRAWNDGVIEADRSSVHTTIAYIYKAIMGNSFYGGDRKRGGLDSDT